MAQSTLTTHTSPFTLLPEWAEQEAVVLAWPHQHSDWLSWIDAARAAYLKLISALNEANVTVILLCPAGELGIVKSMVSLNARVLIIPMDYNDTWTRDYIFVTCESAKGNVPVEFQFNGWGQKFEANSDNLVNQALSKLCRLPLTTCETVLEGGAIEIDQNQVLISTQSCLLNPKRNGDMALSTYRAIFEQYLGAEQVHIFEHGHLEGDDTDGHIDTLVRFTPLRSIVMQSAFNRPNDPHYAGLNALKQEIQEAFSGYPIFELPLPNMINDEGDRLPASYANFLICNQSVLAPVYQQQEDELAIETLQSAFPNHNIVPVDCSTIVQQFGSLHCITMQIPSATLKPEILALANQGVAVYDI
ncbi:agmatine deiminase family protein [Glaciecola siphonariae]|uniref:Agmatine deiminase family protein n=1 Tax=Glaciecola siphonariae TaxID=521012 RepID=A0ABV9LXZ9_9ALTE